MSLWLGFPASDLRVTDSLLGAERSDRRSVFRYGTDVHLDRADTSNHSKRIRSNDPRQPRIRTYKTQKKPQIRRSIQVKLAADRNEQAHSEMARVWNVPRCGHVLGICNVCERKSENGWAASCSSPPCWWAKREGTIASIYTRVVHVQC